MQNIKFNHEGGMINSFGKAGGLIEEFVDTVNRKALLEIWDGLVEETPKCTGYAAANWQISAGIPIKTPIYGTTEQRNAFYKEYGCDDSHYEPQYPDLNKYKKNWTRWYISNPVDYIAHLNAGYSKQAGYHFVEEVIFNVVAKANGMDFV